MDSLVYGRDNQMRFCISALNTKLDIYDNYFSLALAINEGAYGDVHHNKFITTTGLGIDWEQSSTYTQAGNLNIYENIFKSDSPQTNAIRQTGAAGSIPQTAYAWGNRYNNTRKRWLIIRFFKRIFDLFFGHRWRVFHAEAGRAAVVGPGQERDSAQERTQ